MAATIDATVSGASANSYITLANAETTVAERLNTSDWDSATDDNKNRALISAARRLDQEDWKGVKTDADQALKFPRDGLYDEDGNAVDSETVPQRIIDAQCDLAVQMLGDDLLGDSGLEAFKNVKVGPIDVTPRHARATGDLPANVRREVRLWLTTSRSTVKLVRG